VSGASRPRSLLDGAEARRRTGRLLAVPRCVTAALVVGVVAGVATWWWLGVVAGAAAGAALWRWSEVQATTAAARRLGGRRLDPDEHPRLANLVDGLAITVGEPVPDVRVLDDPGANLPAAGPSGGAVLVVTTGLVDALDRVELEAVLAEGFARIRANDAELGARAASLVVGPLLDEAPGRGGSGWRRFAAARRAARLASLLGEQRDFLADLAAVDVTHYPPALGSALDVMARVGTAVSTATWGTAHLWMAPPLPTGPDVAVDDRALTDLFTVHERTEQRIDLLAEL
jgi:heat shock protein HtpX